MNARTRALDDIRSKLMERGRKLMNTGPLDEIEVLCYWLDSPDRRLHIRDDKGTARVGTHLQGFLEEAMMEYIETLIEAFEERLKKVS